MWVLLCETPRRGACQCSEIKQLDFNITCITSTSHILIYVRYQTDYININSTSAIVSVFCLATVWLKKRPKSLSEMLQLSDLSGAGGQMDARELSKMFDMMW